MSSPGDKKRKLDKEDEQEGSPANKKSKKNSDQQVKASLERSYTHTNPETGKVSTRIFKKDENYAELLLKNRRKRTFQQKKQETKAKKQKSKKSSTKKEEHKNNNNDSEEEEVDVKDEEVEFTFHEMCNRYNDHVVIIAGGGQGIGQACALRFAQEGAHVHVIDYKKFKETCELISQKCGINHKKIVKGHLVNVTDSKHVAKIFKEIYDQHGYIDVLVNCAGITGKTGIQSHEVDYKDFEKVHEVNINGTFITCKEVLPYMIKENYGRIINIASISGKEGNAGQVAYSSSKGAVIAMTKSMAKDYATTGITINSIAPAVIQTPMVEAMPKEQQEMMKSKIPMGRTGNLEEISATIAFIAAEENSFTTGFCYDLSGGRATY